MQPQTSTALCINTPLVLNAGPESAKLYRSSVRCPQSTGSQHQAGLDRCLSHCARRSCLSHYGGTWSWWLLETRPWSWCPPLTICRAVRVCTCLDVQPATVSPLAGTFSDAAGSQEGSSQEPPEPAEPPSVTQSPSAPGDWCDGHYPVSLTRREPVPQPSAQRSLCPAGCRIPSPVR